MHRRHSGAKPRAARTSTLSDNDGLTPPRGGADNDFRRRLLEAMAASVAEVGYSATMVADIVRRAHTSRRTFYEYFPDRESCLVALLSEANEANIAAIAQAVDPAAPWRTQIRQAVQAWVACAEAHPSLTLAWIRDVPALGAHARALQRSVMSRFIELVQALSDTPELRVAGIEPLSRARAIMVLGGLRELTAMTVEEDQPLAGIVEEAVRAAIGVVKPDS